KCGIAVLTKCDLVDQETLEVVRLEVEEFLRGSFMEKAPVIPVSSLKGTGLDDFRRTLVQMGLEVHAKDADAITRLPLDRVFTMKGFGTVVTGTLVSGTIHVEDELELFPSGKRARVRGVQVHGVSSDRAVAGERTALNLAGVHKDELQRGMVLASPGLLQASSRLDVQLSLLPSAKPLKNGARVHFHAFSAEAIATVTLYQGRQLDPGTEAFVQLRLSAPQLLLPGDRFVIRQFSPLLTIGGGAVLDRSAHKAPLAARLEFLRALAGGGFEERLLARVQRAGQQGASIPELVLETGETEDRIRPALSALLQTQAIAQHGALVMDQAALHKLAGALQRLVTEFHNQNPLVPGISREELRERARLSPAAFEAGLASCVRDRRLEVAGDLVRAAGRGVTMKDEEARSRELIAQAFATTGLKVPALKEVLAGLKIDHARAQKIVTLLLREKVLVKVSDDLVFHASSLAELRRRLAEEKSRSPKLDVARFKEITGVSRKYAIPLLEYLDRERVTRRQGDVRTIV